MGLMSPPSRAASSMQHANSPPHKFNGATTTITSKRAGRSLIQRLSCLVLSVLLRQQRLLLIAPIIYLSGMLLYMTTVSLDLPRVSKPAPPGSVYRSSQLFHNLWPAMQLSNTSEIKAVWQYPKEGEGWVPCLDRHSDSTELPPSNGYIMIEANGGLNQQRSSICNAVAVAALLNATLVIPDFHFNSVWQDTSTFGGGSEWVDI